MAIDRVRHELKRAPDQHRDASIFVVGTEGQHTEKIYISAYRSNRVKVVAVECDDGASSPEGVLAKVNEIADTFQFGEGDSFWLLVDRDAWTAKMFAHVYRECKKKGYTLCVSNRQFETFLALHFDDFDHQECKKSKCIVKFLKNKLGGFSKEKYDPKPLVALAKSACERCRALDVGGNEIWPDRPGSRADLLVSAIIAKSKVWG
ncbi:MAG: RloB domain-containing protein [Sphingopyxis sp.]|nr:RloB domain-containing protein [Sphingopyxis sp.]